MPSSLHDARVALKHPAADGLTALALDVSGTPLLGQEVLPGQYVRVKLEGFGEGLFALASLPHHQAPLFELLLRKGTPLSDALAQLPVGATVQVGAPEGKGFSLARADGRRLLLFATGSGISAIRSAVQGIRRQPHRYLDPTLYFGVRTPQGFAYADELAAWERDGIHVVQTVSQPGDSGWVGLTGHVQHHLPNESLAEAVAFLCGRREMVAGVTAALAARGMRPENILLNY